MQKKVLKMTTMNGLTIVYNSFVCESFVPTKFIKKKSDPKFKKDYTIKLMKQISLNLKPSLQFRHV